MYSNDEQMLMLRQDILSLGVASWDEQHAIATDRIDSYIDTRWYRAVAKERGVDWMETPFDSSLLSDATQFRDAGTFLALSLAYGLLTKNTTDDGFAPQSKHWDEMYNKEMQAILAYGVGYNWSGVIKQTRRMPRRLHRA